jgi:hypothetical protein
MLAKKRNGVLRSNAETAREDFGKKKQRKKDRRAPELVSFSINGREKLGPDGNLLKKGDVDPHILDTDELCLISPQPLRRGAGRRLYSDPVLGVTLRPGPTGGGGGMMMPHISEDHAFGIGDEQQQQQQQHFEVLSPRADGGMDLWIGHSATALGETTGPSLSFHSKEAPTAQEAAINSAISQAAAVAAGGGGGGRDRQRPRELPPPARFTAAPPDAVVSALRLPKHGLESNRGDVVARYRFRSSQAAGVGNGSASFRAMVEVRVIVLSLALSLCLCL